MNYISHSKIIKLFCEVPHQIAHFHAKALKRTCLLPQDIMQATFVTVPYVDLLTSSRNSEGVACKRSLLKTSNVTKHMPTQFQL